MRPCASAVRHVLTLGDSHVSHRPHTWNALNTHTKRSEHTHETHRTDIFGRALTSKKLDCLLFLHHYSLKHVYSYGNGSSVLATPHICRQNTLISQVAILFPWRNRYVILVRYCIKLGQVIMQLNCAFSEITARWPLITQLNHAVSELTTRWPLITQLNRAVSELTARWPLITQINRAVSELTTRWP